MIGHLIGYGILAAGTVLMVFWFTRRWAAEFQRAAEAALIPVPQPSDSEGEPLPIEAERDGPIVVEASELRGLIREAVREAMTAQSPHGASDVPPAP